MTNVFVGSFFEHGHLSRGTLKYGDAPTILGQSPACFGLSVVACPQLAFTPSNLILPIKPGSMSPFHPLRPPNSVPMCPFKESLYWSQRSFSAQFSVRLPFLCHAIPPEAWTLLCPPSKHGTELSDGDLLVGYTLVGTLPFLSKVQLSQAIVTGPIRRNFWEAERKTITTCPNSTTNNEHPHMTDTTNLQQQHAHTHTFSSVAIQDLLVAYQQALRLSSVSGCIQH